MRTCLAVVLVVGTAAAQEGRGPGAGGAGPRAVAERYVAAALAGKADDAVGLAAEGQSPSRREKIEEFKALVDARAVKLTAVWADDRKGQAIAVSEPVRLTKAQPDGQDEGRLQFALVKSGGQWRVKDIDFRAGDRATDQVERFRKRNPDAKELPAKSGG